ncbi:MAG: flagellin [Candidatus Korobacteraceae bacterium]
MSLSILNNISALTAENNLNATQASLQNTLTQLSSGSRINSGSDDAAGLSIANGLTASIAALTQSVQNSTNGVGLLQTADGALSQVTTLLNRATTLATEASTSGITTGGNSQSAALNNEFSSILSEIDSIGSKTNFNGGAVFGSNGTSNDVQVFMSDGSSSGVSSTSVNINQLSAAQLGLGTTASNTFGGNTNAVATDAVTLGGTTYTFVAAGDPTLTDGNASGTAVTVAIGSSIQGTLQNLADAINGTGQAGTEYESATNGLGYTANTSVQATSVSSTGLTVTADTSGTAGNAVVASFSGTGGLNFTNTDATLNGGSGAALDLNNVTDAQAALTAVTTAINTVASQRGVIGAGVNQLTAASNVMNAQIQNLTSAESGISDADIGTTVANMTKYNTLQQTGISALQQANQASQTILKLLQ